MDCEGSVQTTRGNLDVRSGKIRSPLLGAGPRWPVPDRCRRILAREEARAGLERPADVRRSDIDTAGFEPAVFAGHWGSVDIAGWHDFAAIAEPRPGIGDCNIGLGDGWDETAAHIP
jgi:hypothetical protein